MKEAVGDDCAICVRMSTDMFIGEAGTQLERDCLPFVELCDDIVDVWDINVSGIAEWGEDATPSRFYPQGRALPWQAAVKAISKKPVLGVGRWTNPDLMADAINEGKLDIIATCRPSISDPFLPKKIDEGRLDDIRECIGCNVCISRWEIGGPPLICTQNATAGEEYRRGWHPERFTKAANADNDVLVVGAGPAGMECAMILGKRGMRRVHLVEAQDDMGGIMRWIPQLPGPRRVGARHQLPQDPDRQAAERRVHPEHEAGREGRGRSTEPRSSSSRPAATGRPTASTAPRTTPIPGADASLAWQATPEQIMGEGKQLEGSGSSIVRQRRLLHGRLDRREAGDGGQEGHADDADGHRRAVHALHARGAEPAPQAAQARRRDRHLPPAGADRGGRRSSRSTSTTRTATSTRSRRTVSCSSRSGARTRRSSATLKDDVGLDALEAEGVNALYRIGDCEAPRLIADAVFSGHRLAREIDSADPSVPLPFKRERRLVDAESVARATGRARGGVTRRRRSPRCESSSAVKQVLQSSGTRSSSRHDGRDVDPDYLDPALNEWDSFATEEALQLRERLGGGEVVVVTSAPRRRRRRCGAASRWGRTARSGSRAQAVTRSRSRVRSPTSSAPRAPDLVLCGVQSSDCRAGGDRHGARRAARTCRAAPSSQRSTTTRVRGSAVVDRELEGGLVDVVEVDTPALLTIQTGINEPRYANLRAIKQAEQVEIDVRSAADGGVPAYRVRGCSCPTRGEGAEMIDGSPAQIAGRIARS